MADIVKRLREHADTGNRPSQWPADMREAADEIKRLRAASANLDVRCARGCVLKKVNSAMRKSARALDGGKR